MEGAPADAEPVTFSYSVKDASGNEISADKVTREDWLNSPGGRSSDFSQYNVIVFGDSLFN